MKRVVEASLRQSNYWKSTSRFGNPGRVENVPARKMVELITAFFLLEFDIPKTRENVRLKLLSCPYVSYRNSYKSIFVLLDFTYVHAYSTENFRGFNAVGIFLY